MTHFQMRVKALLGIPMPAHMRMGAECAARESAMQNWKSDTAVDLGEILSGVIKPGRHQRMRAHMLCQLRNYGNVLVLWRAGCV